MKEHSHHELWMYIVGAFICIVVIALIIGINVQPWLTTKPVCSQYAVEEVAEVRCVYGCIPYDGKYYTQVAHCHSTEGYDFYGCYILEGKTAVLVNKTTDKCLEYKVVPR